MNSFKHTIGHSLYAIGAFMLIFAVTLLQPVSIIYSRAVNATEIIELSNQVRRNLDEPELKINQALMNAAQAKAEDMIQKRYFAHYGPNGEKPWDFIRNSGYSYAVAGENLAITNESDRAVIDGWMDSPTHRANLLSSKYSDIGVGIAYYGDYEQHKNTTVIVAMYARSKPITEVTGTEQTAPAGTVAALQGGIFSSANTNYIIASAIALIVAGLFLEIRHIRKQHHQHKSSHA